MKRKGSLLFGLVPDEGYNHAVEVEEKHDEVEAKLDERFLVHPLATKNVTVRK